MASANLAKNEKAKKLKALLGTRGGRDTPAKFGMLTLAAFAKALPDRIESSPSSAILSNELSTHIEALPLTSAAASDKKVELDRVGTDLWNLSTHLRRDERSSSGQLPCLLRVFAFLLLDSIQPGVRCGAHNCVRLLKVALKTAKACLDTAQLELCAKSLERAARYEEELSKPAANEGPVEGLSYKKLRAEYYILRTALVGSRLCPRFVI